MIDSKRVLGVITARGGSKGLPRKNIRPLMGKPLIQWTIETALAAPSLDMVVVSTDDMEIANVSRVAGAQIPFYRPPELSGDSASSVDVVLHAIDELEKCGEFFDLVVLLEPTSPLREVVDIEQSLSQLLAQGKGSVVGICRAESQHPSFVFDLDAEKMIKPYLKVQPTGLRRQDINSLYFVEGTIYCSFIDSLRIERSFYHAFTGGYEVPKWKSFEVDDIYDFVMIEALANLTRS